MDPRFEVAPIFDRRRTEWSKDNILNHVRALFASVEMVEGWKLISCEWGREVKSTRKEELKRHILSSINVVLQDASERQYTYDIQIPELIENQFFYIGGYLKIPVFQIYDYPVIFRKRLLKIRTNTITLSVDLGRDDGAVKLSIFNKSVPIEYLITACYTQEELEQFLLDKTEENPTLTRIVTACVLRWSETTEEQRIGELGDFFISANTDRMKKGYSVIFSLNAAYKLDHFSHQFFKTDSILFEILNSIYEGPKSDNDVKRKRIRFSEYILSPLIRKVYDLLLTIYNSKNVKFQINQGIIVDSCNISDIIHFNFPINPISELASFCQATLTGPGGFKKDNVPAHLRDLDDSQYGLICPADTPDRDGCGVILNMVPVINLDNSGNFGEPNEEIITSYPIALSPFLEHNDQVRLQMASNHLKQSIILRESERPRIRSGVEDCYLDHSTFMYRAKKNGVVAHMDPKFMIIVYEDGTSDMLRISYRNMYLNTMDLLIPKFNEGDSFNRGDILCESACIKDGELALGQNLLTGIAIWKGYNYEDGVVLSDRVTNGKFRSLHSVDLTFTIEPGQVLITLDNNGYNPIPKIGDIIKKGDCCAKIKTLDGEDGFESINIEPFEVLSGSDCIITDIEIYPNSWNKKVDEFDKFIQEMIIKQTDRFVTLTDKLLTHMSKEEVDKFIQLHGLMRLNCSSRVGKYSYKSQNFGGVIIKIQGVFEENIGIGDKVANRHGNKGVVSKILPESMMPVLEDGRRLDIVLNPLGIISRMNTGQLSELSMTEAIYHLEKNMENMSDEEKIEALEYFLSIVDKTEDKWITDRVLNEFRITGKINMIQSPFQSIGPEDMFKIMEFTGASFKQYITDPTQNITIKNPVSVGYMYFLKLVHRASDKTSARSIGPYSKKTLQPLGGKSKLGGHRLGEMETWALMAHGAKGLLSDILTIQSDSPGRKNKFLANVLQNPELAASDQSDTTPQSLRLLENYLNILGLRIKESTPTTTNVVPATTQEIEGE